MIVASIRMSKLNPQIRNVLKDAIYECGRDKDVTLGISKAFLKFNRNGFENISISFASSLKPNELEWAFDICKENMEDIYDASGYGWDDDDKKSELTESGARFLLLHDESNDDKPLIGFVHFRFTVQGEILESMAGLPTLYLWDIHIDEDYQRKGLGKHLLIVLELIARQQKMECVSIPIQDKDNMSMSWISKIRGYEPDIQLKSTINFDSELEGFQIYAKYFQSTAAATVNKTPTKIVLSAASTSTSPASIAAIQTDTGSTITNKGSAAVLSTTNNQNQVDDHEEMIQIDDDTSVPLSVALEQLKDCYKLQNNNNDPTQDIIDSWLVTLKASQVNSVRTQIETSGSGNASAATSADECEEVEGFQFININDIPKE